MDVDLLKDCGKVVTFQGGQSICREGETGHSMFVLLKGSAEVLINSFSDNPQSVGLVEEGSHAQHLLLRYPNRLLYWRFPRPILQCFY